MEVSIWWLIAGYFAGWPVAAFLYGLVERGPEDSWGAVCFFWPALMIVIVIVGTIAALEGLAKAGAHTRRRLEAKWGRR